MGRQQEKFAGSVFGGLGSGDPDESLDVLVARLAAAEPDPDPLRQRRVLAALEGRMFGKGKAVAFDHPTMGRYEVVREIGRGGMGVLYEAYDPRLDRSVAIKLLHRRTGQTGASAQAFLVNEAKAAARIVHRNLVGVFDVGWTVDPRMPAAGEVAYVVMELVRGRTLADWVQEIRPEPSQLMDLLVQTARGLAALHRAGLIHRDVKPSNILIDDCGVAKLVDFGLARWSSPKADEIDTVAPRDPSGTPAYMAPEQHLGIRVDPRADQFAFCATAFEAIHGALPFRASSATDLLHAKRTTRIGAPKLRGYPPGTSRVLARGMDPDPAARFDDMDALIEALTIGPRRWALPLLAVAALGTTAGAIAAASDPCAAAEPDVSAVGECSSILAPDEAGLRPQLAAVLSRVAALEAAGQLEDAIDLLGASFDRALASRDQTLLRIRHARLLLQGGRLDDALDASTEAMRSAESLAAPALSIRAMLIAARARHARGEYASAMELVELADIRAEKLDARSTLRAELCDARGVIEMSRGHHAEAARLHGEAAMRWRDSTDGAPENERASLALRARALAMLGQHDRAIATLIAARETARSKPGSRDLDIGLHDYELSIALRKAGRLRDARVFAREAVAFLSAAPNVWPLDRIESLEELAIVEIHLGQPARALDLAERYVAQMQALVGDRHLGLCDGLAIAALAALQLGRPTEALGHVQRALVVYDRARDEHPALRGALQVIAARVLLEFGDPQGASRESAAAISAFVSIDAPAELRLDAEAARLLALAGEGWHATVVGSTDRLVEDIRAAELTPVMRGALLRAAGQVYIASEQWGRAGAVIAEANQALQRHRAELPDEAVGARLDAAIVGLRVGDVGDARRHCDVATRWVVELELQTIGAARVVHVCAMLGVRRPTEPSIAGLGAEEETYARWEDDDRSLRRSLEVALDR